MRLQRLILENFQGIHSLELDFGGKNTTIYGDNATGKTTVYNAVTWLLFDKASTGAKGFTPKTQGRNGDIHNLNHSAEAVFTKDNGEGLELKKCFHEVYKKKKGSAEAEFSGHTTDYFVNGIPAKEKEYQAAIADICDAEAMKILTMPTYFSEEMEERRIEKNNSNKDHKYDNNLPMTWANVNLKDLAVSLMHYAKIGLDMQEKHLYPIPYKNKRTNKYDITLMEGYGGIQYIAEKYAIEKPLAVDVRLVYSTDKFTPIYKDMRNKVEGYILDPGNPFDRGDVVGGFGYIQYEDERKNKLVIMSLKDIEKRKPEYAAAEFWGGTKAEWKNGKKIDVETDGWYEEMCIKTIKRAVYSAKYIPRDPAKIDENYRFIKNAEIERAESEAQKEIDENANRIIISTDAREFETVKELPTRAVDAETGEIIPDAPAAATIAADDERELLPDF